MTLSNQIIDISVYPEASFANAAPLVGCIDSAMAFDINTDNADSYLWIFEGGTPDTSLVPNPTVVYNNSGTYLITLIVGNTLGFDTATTSITIVDFPTADFTFDINGFTTEFEYTGTMANNYNWNFGDGTTSTEENPSHTYASNGTYTVVLVINGSCGQDTVKSDILIDVSSTEDQKH